MRNTIVVLAVLAAVILVAQVADLAEKKTFDTLKECMMCMKTNCGAAGKAIEARDYSGLAENAEALGECAACAKKKFCTSMDFAMGCDKMKEQADSLLKAAKASDPDAASKAMEALKETCKMCHEKCR